MKHSFPLLAAVLTGTLLLAAGCGKTQPPAPAATAAPQPAATAQPTQAPAATPTQTPAATPDATETPAPTEAPPADPNRVEITDENFAAALSEMQSVPELYFEKTIHLQGIYLQEQPEGMGITTHAVYRLGLSGAEDAELENGEEAIYSILFLPPEDFAAETGDWIDVTGVLRDVTIDGYPFLALDEVSVFVDNAHRGSDTVSNLY